MCNDPTTFRGLIDQWGGVPKFQADLGLPYVTAQKMYQRDSIAVRHWPRVLEIATAKGMALSADDLIRMRAASLSEAA